MEHILDSLDTIPCIVKETFWRHAGLADYNPEQLRTDNPPARILTTLVETLNLFHDLLLELSEQENLIKADFFISIFPRSLHPKLAREAFKNKTLEESIEVLDELEKYVLNKLEILAIAQPFALPALARRDKEEATRRELNGLEPLTLPEEEVVENILNAVTKPITAIGPGDYLHQKTELINSLSVLPLKKDEKNKSNFSEFLSTVFHTK